MKLLSRSFYGPPPIGPHHTQDDHPTLLWSWFCTMMSLVVIIVRIFGRLARTNYLFREDIVMIISIVPLMIRMALIHYVLIWGTNNIDTSVQLSSTEIEHRIAGSKLVLGARIFYAIFLWTCKLTVSEFLRRLTEQYWKTSFRLSLRIIRLFLIISFTAVAISTIAECIPSTHYWQVIPDPGPRCRQCYAQLITMATADVTTDVFLIVFPICVIAPASGMPILQRFRLVILFFASAILPAIAIARVINVTEYKGKQQRRTVFASGEILAATFVANSLVLGSFIRDRGVKKNKWRHSQQSETSATLDTDPENGAILTQIKSSTSIAGTTPGTIGSRTGSSSGALTMSRSRRPTVATTFELEPEDEELFADMCYISSYRQHDSIANASPRPAQAITPSELEPQDHTLSSRAVPPLSEPPFHPNSSISPGSRDNSVVRGRNPARNIMRLKGKASGSLGSLGSRKASQSSRRGSKSREPSLGPGQKLNKSVTFEDIGGLLDDTTHTDHSEVTTIVGPAGTGDNLQTADLRRSDERTRAGSIAELQDIGGLLSDKRNLHNDEDDMAIKEVRQI